MLPPKGHGYLYREDSTSPAHTQRHAGRCDGDLVVAIFVNDLSNLLQLAMSNRNRGVRKK